MICKALKIRKHHPCNTCGNPIVKASEVYKHEGHRPPRNWPVWFYVCESCHFLASLSNEKCGIDKKEWDEAKMFWIQENGVAEPWLRHGGRLIKWEEPAPDVKIVSISGKLIWENGKLVME